ncbi:TRAP transporter small permease [Bacillus sp. UNC41MFS5]|uniref:TRAP transporter small permease n=1 Tax=Bacillus sp. UNC41MFS5 TaxID=1449046 RepID=UPI000B15BA07|nr:TRAP transporter small permease [Bacillus sp. UNC41MFS5]
MEEADNIKSLQNTVFSQNTIDTEEAGNISAIPNEEIVKNIHGDRSKNSRFVRILLVIDRALEGFALLALVSMILIVTMQVITRKLFNFVFFWSEEVTLLLLIWFSFMGIAIGFREKLHLGMDSFTNLFPKPINWILDKIIFTSIFLFGFYLVFYGWNFTKMMHSSILPATGLPNSITYVVMPITGVMTCAYSLVQFFGIETKRHHGMDGGGH